jgi:hypothetical protein
MRIDRVVLFFVAASGLTFSTGCVVPQPRGQGLYSYVQEPTTKTWYNLYLPVDYVKNNGRHPDSRQQRWPLVMTFHGMKPYDNALPQEREWEKQADIYGYIVCAPELETSDSFMEYPITREHSYVMDDRRNVIAIMDHVFATTLADPRRVLATSWSCGGYLAHYFPNRFPDRFSCIATRLSNFSAKLMAEETVPLYRDKTPIAIFIGDGDFPACKTESEEAVAWYTARGFRVVRGKMIDNMGHRRIPQTAAAFFAEGMGITPLHPLEAAETVAQVQMTEYHPTQEMIAQLSPPIGLELARSAMPTRNLPAQATPAVVPPTRDARPSPTAPQGRKVAYNNSSAGRQYPSDRKPAYDPNPNSEVPKPSAPKGTSPTESPPAKVASASPSQRNNWLTTPKVQPPAAPASATNPTANPEPLGPANLERSAASTAPAKSHKPVESKTPPKPAETKPAARQAAPASALALNTPTRRFTQRGFKSYAPVCVKVSSERGAGNRQADG